MRAVLLALLAAALLIEVVDAQQPNMQSANYMLPACKNSLALGDTMPSTAIYLAGVCMGTVHTFGIVSKFLPDPIKSCPPLGVTPEQQIRVIIAYIEARPQRM